MSAISTRLSAISGAYFVVAVLVGSRGPERTTMGLLVILSGFVALLVFLAVLSRLLSRDGGVRSGWPAMTTSCGLIFLARVLPARLTWPGVAVGMLAATGALGVLSGDSFLPIPYVTGLAWKAVVSVLLAVRPSRPATGAASEGVTGRADAVGRV